MNNDLIVSPDEQQPCVICEEITDNLSVQYKCFLCSEKCLEQLRKDIKAFNEVSKINFQDAYLINSIKESKQ